MAGPSAVVAGRFPATPFRARRPDPAATFDSCPSDPVNCANDVTLATASGTGTITKNNAGRLDITGALGTGGVTLNANAGATNIAASETLAALNIANGATVTLGTIPPSPAPDFGASAQPVPEPATGLLAVFGAIVAATRARRRRDAARSGSRRVAGH